MSYSFSYSFSGLWPASSMPIMGVVFFVVSSSVVGSAVEWHSGHHHCLQQQEWGRLCHKCSLWVQLCIKHFFLKCRDWGVQVATILVQAKPGTGGPKSWPTAISQWRVHKLSRFWRWQWYHGKPSQLPKKEVATVANSYQLFMAAMLQLLNRTFHQQCAFMLSFLDLVRQGGSLSLRIYLW
jgi:hypothetical protein